MKLLIVDFDPAAYLLRTRTPIKINLVMQIHSTSQSPSNDPILAVDLFFDRISRKRRDAAAPFQSFQQDVILRPREVDETISRGIGLQARWRDHTVDVGSKQPIGEFHHGIAQVDDGMARQRSHVTPFSIFARRENLQSTKTVEKDGDAAKVCMLSQRGASVILRLWRRLDEAYLVSA